MKSPKTAAKAAGHFLLTAGVLCLGLLNVAATVTLEFHFGRLNVAPGTIGILVADANGNGFQSLGDPDSIGTVTNVGQTIGTSDDVIMAVIQADGSGHWGGGGATGFAETFEGIDYDALGVAPGAPLIFYWFPGVLVPGASLSEAGAYHSFRSSGAGGSGGTIGFALPANRGVYSISHTSAEFGGDLDPGDLAASGTADDGLIGVEVTEIVINEVNAATLGGAVGEFIELFAPGHPNTQLDGLVLVLFDGAGDTTYRAIDLDGINTDGNGFAVIGNAGVPGVDATFAAGTLQDGADAIGIYVGNGVDFPGGSPVTVSGLVDALVYDNGQADDAGLLALLHGGQAQVNEDGGGNGGGHSLQRLPNGSGGARNTNTIAVIATTPNTLNGLPPAPTLPDLTSATDTGISNSDELTRNAMPVFTGTARVGAIVSIYSSVNNLVGSAATDGAGTWTIQAGLLDEGDHKITARADGGAASGALDVRIDTMAPDPPASLDLLSVDDSGIFDDDEVTRVTTPRIALSAEAGGTISLSTDFGVGGVVAGAPMLTGTITLTTVALADGGHNLTAIVADAAGNPSQPSDPLAVTIDTIAPLAPTSLDLLSATDSGDPSDNVTNFQVLQIAGMAESGSTVMLASSGVVGTIGSGPSNGTFTLSTNSLDGGPHNITAQAMDVAGNVGPASTPPLQVVVDLTGPAVTVEQPKPGQADPATTQPIAFRAVFSEPVLGFESGDVSIGGTAGPTTVSVGETAPNNGTTFDLSVSGAPREGTVTASIGASVVTDLAGNPNAASTSSDNSVTLDLHGDDPGSATMVTLAGGVGVVPGWLAGNDVDVFKFVLTEARYVSIYTTGSIDTFGRLFDEAVVLLNDADADDNRGDGNNFRIELPLAPGTYYVAVDGKGGNQVGAYQLHIEHGVPAKLQPDLWIGTSRTNAVGDGVFEGLQRKRLFSRKGRRVRGVLGIDNEGEVPDMFSIQGRRGTKLFVLVYTAPTGNVTGQVTTGQYQTPVMKPGDEPHAITIVVRPKKSKLKRTVGAGSKKRVKWLKKGISIPLTGTSLIDPSTSDTVTLQVKTK